MKIKLIIGALAALCAAPLVSSGQEQQQYVLQTQNNAVVFTTNDAKVALQYFGPKLDASDIQSLLASRLGFNQNTYPAFGMGEDNFNTALSLEMPDGNLSVDLKLQDVKEEAIKEGKQLVFTYKDQSYPFSVKQYYRSYQGTDIVSTWTELTNEGKDEIKLLEFASACVPIKKGDNYLTQFHGSWGCETYMTESPLPVGTSVICGGDAVRNAFVSQAGFMISIDGKPQENAGRVFGGNLVYTGDYKTNVVATQSDVTVISGINPDHSTYYLTKNETFTTPEFLMTVSSEGKGGVSRAFHRWARMYGLHGSDSLRDILLNSWEGVYMDVNQEVMDKMMSDFKAIGGELFVMDDGWFGDKYARNYDDKGLGDWMVNKKKLPQGVPGLTVAAMKHDIKFGIWIEPEMANTASELYEKHPEWVLQQPNRPLVQGRGGTQVMLDMTNPKVQDYVFSIVDNLMQENPSIAYMKWDCNASFMNYGSTYLPANRQSELSIRYNRGLQAVCERIRAKYPNLVIQDCASGGGRVNFGMLRYFDEFWTSDNTDAMQRLFIQWGDSHFYPARAMASHVSASPNHQTGRVVPLKFRFDVAMSGRLGMELQPSTLTDEEKVFSKRAIAAYKEIRPIVQNGDLYRLVSPYDGGAVSSLMYATENKDKAVVYVYRISSLNNQYVPTLCLDGVDENKTYRIHDLTPQNEKRPCILDGKVISGRVLKTRGLDLGMLVPRFMSSVALELIAE